VLELGAVINPAHGKVPKFFKASRMLAYEGNTEQKALLGKGFGSF
jgi:hypothetical protein